MKDYERYLPEEDKGCFVLKYVEDGPNLKVLISSNCQKRWFTIPNNIQNKELIKMKMMEQVYNIDYIKNELTLDILNKGSLSISLVLAGEITDLAYKYPNSFPLSLSLFTIPLITLTIKKNMKNNLKKTKSLKDDFKIIEDFNENFEIKDIDNVLNNIPKKTSDYVKLNGINPNSIDKVSYRNYKKILENIKAYRELLNDLNDTDKQEEAQRIIERRKFYEIYKRTCL